jgi:hypothetical protein
MSHKYFYLYRPPSYGCQPDGWTNREGGLPQKYYDTQHGPVRSFGWVEYPEPLTIEQCWKWELIADDPVEWAKYVFWEYASRDYLLAQDCREDYINAYRTKTGRIPEQLREPTRILAEAQP